MSSPLAQPRLRVPVRLFVEHEAWRRTHEWHAKDRRGRDVGADWLKAELDAAKLILFFAVGEEILRGEREAWLRPKMVRYRILAPVTFDSGVPYVDGATGRVARPPTRKLRSWALPNHRASAIQGGRGRRVRWGARAGRAD